MTEELRKAIETLENEGLCICNQYNGCFGTENAEYELWNREEIVEYHLTAEDIIEKANEIQRSEGEEKMRVKTYAESGEWFGRIEELVEEIEENGYEVLEANAESVTFEDDDEEQYVACVGGTERTMYIESIREA